MNCKTVKLSYVFAAVLLTPVFFALLVLVGVLFLIGWPFFVVYSILATAGRTEEGTTHE
jgi:hypothetical protein